MSKLIFVNLPVADLGRSIAFYEAIGATKNPIFSDETAACMVISDVIHVMILTHDKFRQFTPRAVADARSATEVLLCLSAESRQAVDDITEKALAAGGAEVRPAEDHGFMYGRAFEDPDGHIWEPMWMDMAAASEALGAAPVEAA
ncbi:MAG: VOC family protein [Alphaproteobacteria bacterium]|nr:VOC family protein [Alphaproteobacteria bacterium]MBV9371808.1 VOC family protein [Alphaproteobacteria bacterium]MBV9901907.1 VOC family protein [Alphaproteobacteria bacterium]